MTVLSPPRLITTPDRLWTAVPGLAQVGGMPRHAFHVSWLLGGGLWDFLKIVKQGFFYLNRTPPGELIPGPGRAPEGCLGPDAGRTKPQAWGTRQLGPSKVFKGLVLARFWGTSKEAKNGLFRFFQVPERLRTGPPGVGRVGGKVWNTSPPSRHF